MTLPNSDNVIDWYDLESNTILFDNSNYESE